MTGVWGVTEVVGVSGVTGVTVASLAERPEALERVTGMADSWPPFVVNDLVGNAHYGRIATELPQYVLFAEDENGDVVAHAYSVPFALGADAAADSPPGAGTRSSSGPSPTCAVVSGPTPSAPSPSSSPRTPRGAACPP